MMLKVYYWRQLRMINVVIFSEDKTLYGLKGEVPEEYYTVPIGKAAVRREGKDLTIVTIGKMLYVAMSRRPLGKRQHFCRSD